MRVCLIDVEALSDKRSTSLVECGADNLAQLLWPALKQFYAIVPYASLDDEKLQYWLDREGFVGAIKTIPNTDDASEMITRLRGQGHDVQLLVSNKVAHLLAAHDEGVASLLAVAPIYGRKEWAPDHDSSPIEWQLIAEAVEKKRLELAEDKRITEVLN